MKLFSELFKSRDKSQNRTAGSNYAFFMGGTTSGKTVAAMITELRSMTAGGYCLFSSAKTVEYQKFLHFGAFA